MKIKRYDTSIDLEIIKKYIMPQAQDNELFLFFQKCKLYGLNPFKNEIYAIPYKSENGEIRYSIVISYQVFMKRAYSNPNFAGFQSGIILMNSKGELEYREGTFMLQSEKLLGGWCKVFRKDWLNPLFISVNLESYQKETKIWRNLTSFMIMKVAIATAFRMAFPDELQGLYIEEEIREANEEKNRLINEIVAMAKSKNLIEDAKKFINDIGKRELKDLDYNELLQLHSYLLKKGDEDDSKLSWKTHKRSKT